MSACLSYTIHPDKAARGFIFFLFFFAAIMRKMEFMRRVIKLNKHTGMCVQKQ